MLASSVLVAATSHAWSAAPPGLDPAKALTQYGLDTWTTDHGLPNATINAILQSRDGYLWLGTYDGLARFDGVRFTVFNRSNTPELGNNGIRALCEDRAGDVWIGTNGGGLSRMSAGRFTRYTTADGLPANSVWSLHTDERDGSVWIGTNGGGLSRYKDGRFSNYPVADSGHTLYSISQGPDGSLWLGTQGDGLRRLAPNGSFTAFTAAEGLPRHLVTASAFDRDGSLWVGMTGGGVALVQDGRFVPVPPALRALSATSVSAILQDREGTLWIATNGGGLARYSAGRLSFMTVKDGLPGDVLYSLREDREGTLWIGTNGAGIARLRDGSFSTIAAREGLSRDFVYTGFEDAAGTFFVGTAGGVDSLENGRWSHVTAASGDQPYAVRSITQHRDGSLWVGSYGAGVWRRQGTRWTAYRARDGLANDNVRALLADRAGRLWAATVGGLSVFQDGAWRSFAADAILATGSLIGIAEDRDGSLWVGTDGRGLYRLRDGRVELFTMSDGLPSDLVLALHVDAEGVLWVGTNGGLARFRNGRFASFTVAAGLPGDAVAQVVDDALGNLWIGTSRGVSRISKAGLERYALGQDKSLELRTFDRADGMKSSQCTAPAQPAGFRARDGRLWFATSRGIAVVDPARLRPELPAPPVVIEEVLIDARSVPPTGVVQVPPGPARIQFRYSGLSLFSPDRLSFRFRLEGFDDDWVNARHLRLADYTSVPPGDYVFRAGARSANGAWNEVGAALPLRVLPRLYQTRTFALAVTLLLVGLIAAGHRLRVQSLESRGHELKQLVGDRTRSLAEAKERAEAEREQAERLLAATMAIGATIDLESVLGLILAELQRVVPYDSASVQELRGFRLEIVAGRGFTNIGGIRGEGFDIRAGDNPNREVLERKQPLILEDAPLRYPGFSIAPGASGIRAWLGVPLLFGDRIIGMLTLDKREPGFYHAEHARVAVAFAAQAAIALENARLYAAARRELAERERAQAELRRQSGYLASLHETALAVMNRLELGALLEALVTRAASLLEAPNGFLYLENEAGSALERQVWIGSPPRDLSVAPNEGAVGHVWQSGQPLAIDDYDTWQGRSKQVSSGLFGSMVAVPLRFDGRVKGALGLAHDRSGARFGEPEVRLLSSFGQLASLALDNARLFEREHAARERAERLQAATRALSATIDLGGVFNLILLELEKVVPSDSASVQELKGDRLQIIGGRGHAAEVIGHSFELSEGDGRSQEVLTRREPLIREAAPFADGHFGSAPALGLRSWMGVPLLFGDRVIGMLALNKSEPGFYTPELASLAQAFATQAAVAIENARLFDAARQELVDRKQAQEALQESEERFRQLAENIEAVFFMRSIDPADAESPVRVLYVSPAYEKVWGRPLEAAYRGEAGTIDTIHPEDRDRYRAAIRGQRDGYDIEYRILHPDGSTRWIHTRAFPVRGAPGAVSRVAGIAEDVTSRKRVEQLREDLTRTMVHDLKNPLTSIMGSVEVLTFSLQTVLTPQQRRTLAIALNNSRRLLRLVETILDVSRLEGGAMPVERERLSLQALVAELLELQRPLAEPRRLSLASDVPSGLPEVWADRALVSRVLQNLVGNAIKFTPEGGSIRVIVRLDGDEGTALRIAVSDTGPGVPEEMRGRLFQRFAAGSQPGRGSGLGLLFCKLAVEAQDGHIWAEGAPGEGASFCFTLPVVEYAGAASAPQRSAAEGDEAERER